jgi:hypothetical protein
LKSLAGLNAPKTAFIKGYDQLLPLKIAKADATTTNPEFNVSFPSIIETLMGNNDDKSCLPCKLRKLIPLILTVLSENANVGGFKKSMVKQESCC